MGDLHFIATALSAVPFSLQLSAVSLSERSQQEVLQLLSDVAATISPIHKKVDVHHENVEQTLGRLAGFLQAVKFPGLFPIEELLAGDKEALYGMLQWLMEEERQQPCILQKRALVGYYLSNPELPTDMLQYEDVLELRGEIKAYQEEFVALHKQTDANRGARRDAGELKAELLQLEDQKERLAEKVARAKAKIKDVPELATWQDACAALRAQQEEEAALKLQLSQQQQQLEGTEAKLQRALAHLREVRLTAMDGSSAKLLEQMHEEVGQLQLAVQQTLPREKERKAKRLQAIAQVLGQGVNTEEDVQQQQATLRMLQADVQTILDARAASTVVDAGDKVQLQLRQAQQMANVVAKKRDEALAKLARLQEKQAALQQQHEQNLAAQEGASQGALSPAEWQAKEDFIQAKLPQYKGMKAEIGALDAELLQLAQRVEELQRQEQEALADSILQARKSRAGSQEEVAPGGALADLSNVVKARKAQLAPQIQQLRSMRQTCQDLETQHSQKKHAYDAATLGRDSKVSQVEAELAGIKTELADAEARLKWLGDQAPVLETQAQRISNPSSCQEAKAQLQQQVRALEQTLANLNAQRSAVAGEQGPSVSQLDQINGLRKLLDLKIRLYRQGGHSTALFGGGAMLAGQQLSYNAMNSGMGNLGFGQPQGFGSGTANVMTL
ncbi:hypothetical protein WJX72_007340 [[Myrmecia] bisecta]|uniref:IFT81 calponin homology domain-containing protein n=1 Tax=[Myrmecia] bisecta TaxID=41462 RepID=A0AAW1PSM0_9CHLO